MSPSRDVFEGTVDQVLDKIGLPPDSVSISVLALPQADAQPGALPETVFGRNEHKLHPAASLAKLAILYALRSMTDVDNDRRLDLTNNIVPGSGFLQYLSKESATVHDLLQHLILFSDNTAAKALIFELFGGVEQINEPLKQILGSNTHAGLIDLSDGDSHAFSHGSISAYETALLMAAVQNEPLLRRNYIPYGMRAGYDGNFLPKLRIEALQKLASRNPKLAQFICDRYITRLLANPHELPVKNGYYDDGEESVHNMVASNSISVVAALVETEPDRRTRHQANRLAYNLGELLRV